MKNIRYRTPLVVSVIAVISIALIVFSAYKTSAYVMISPDDHSVVNSFKYVGETEPTQPSTEPVTEPSEPSSEPTSESTEPTSESTAPSSAPSSEPETETTTTVSTEPTETVAPTKPSPTQNATSATTSATPNSVDSGNGGLKTGESLVLILVFVLLSVAAGLIILFYYKRKPSTARHGRK